MNMSGRARLGRALVGSGIVAAAAVFGTSGPAPGQEVPGVPEVQYLDAYGPAIYGYEDCDGVVSTEEDPQGFVFVELDEAATIDLSVGITFSGSLEDDLVDPPTEIVIEAGEFFGEASFELDALETGDLTVTVEDGTPLYTIDDDVDPYTFEVTDEVQIVASCLDDLGTPPGGTDRQTIDIGERPEPIGFFDEDDDFDEGDDGDDGGATTTESDGGATTEPATTATTEPLPVSAELARVRALRAVPTGYSTPVADGTLPPGLTYVDDEWTGAATTAGTYAFDVRLCFDQSSFLVEGAPATDAERAMGRRQVRAFPNVICFGYVDVQIVVNAPAPPTVAPPASPVTARAQFTG